MPFSSVDAYYFFLGYLYQHPIIVPLGVVGVWRWGVWSFKELLGLLYRPAKKPYRTTVSIVTPVYNEDPKVFAQALNSWTVNNPAEIIAVIDYSDTKCIDAFKKFAKKCRYTRLVVTKKPGKRPALADGIKLAKSKIVALVDSDTIWAPDVITKGLCPFNDKKVAGVGTYQSVLKPQTFAQKVFDTHLDIRYTNEFPFLAATGTALTCLSGRTAFYRRDIILPHLPELVNETFWGRPVISGDDKALTYMVLRAGWKVAFQANTTVYTPGMHGLSAYVKQRIRWSRNALRADIKAFSQGWTWRHPSLVFFQFDKLLQTFVLILSPIFVGIYLMKGLYIPALFIIGWWIFSRTVKIYAHLWRRPQDIVILPSYILFSLFMGLVKIYSFVTLNTQGWITRWDSARAPRLRFVEHVFGYAFSAAIVVGIVYGTYFVKNKTYFIPYSQQQSLVEETMNREGNFDKNAVQKAQMPAMPNLLSSKYVVQNGDTLSTIAAKNEISLDTLLAANISFLTNWNRLTQGTTLTIPGRDVVLPLVTKFNYQRYYPDPLRISYDSPTNTIIIAGRGNEVNLHTIAQGVGGQYLVEVAPKVWYLSASIYLGSGVSFTLDKNEVSWFQMASSHDSYVDIRGYNTKVSINGVKITSWDKSANDYDKNLDDGRSYIMVKDGSRMDITDSELAYLGFARSLDMPASPYGVSWKMSRGKWGTTLLTGEVVGSQFHHNYFGAYTFGATGMMWKGNKFYNNVRYGLDPHDDSNGFLVADNESYANGTHGIIFSKRCRFNTIVDNYSHDNTLHGIMLHEASNDNLISGNRLENNHNGIALWHSSNNLIKDNTVVNNKQGIRANSESNTNTIVHNTITKTAGYALYFYSGSRGNSVYDNTIQESGVAVYLKSSENSIFDNTMLFNKVGVYLLADAQGNNVYDNTIKYNSKYGIYSKLKEGLHNYALGNTFLLNRQNVFATIATQ